MPIVFSNHAKLQLKRRNISQKIVIETITSSHQKVSSYKDRKLRQRKVGVKILEVVTKTEGSKITVITAYYLHK